MSELKTVPGRSTAVAWLKTWEPALVCTGVILVESTPWFSAGHTSGRLRAVWSFLFGPVEDARWDTVHFLIRKTGHFTGYGLVALSYLWGWTRQWSLQVRVYRLRLGYAAVMALFCTMLIACYDEIHQSYMPSRTGEAQDVLLDSTGAALFLVVAWMIRRRRASNG